jgi:hypothetical protein
MHLRNHEREARVSVREQFDGCYLYDVVGSKKMTKAISQYVREIGRIDTKRFQKYCEQLKRAKSLDKVGELTVLRTQVMAHAVCFDLLFDSRTIFCFVYVNYLYPICIWCHLDVFT